MALFFKIEILNVFRDIRPDKTQIKVRHVWCKFTQKMHGIIPENMRSKSIGEAWSFTAQNGNEIISQGSGRTYFLVYAFMTQL